MLFHLLFSCERFVTVNGINECFINEGDCSIRIYKYFKTSNMTKCFIRVYRSFSKGKIISDLLTSLLTGGFHGNQ